ncbi:MAG TPA: hypothetical protein VGX21_16910 [Methylomirabilota bacterium]|jgi:hypothetical protein|nr:hypothetical protein [Methylomirabilota bacterium]
MGFVVVVRRDEVGLFEYLQQHLQEPGVSVLLDRRLGERRGRNGDVGDDRRRTDRRGGRDGEDPLWKYGFRVSVTQG